MKAARRADFRGSLVRAAGRANKERRTCFSLLSLPRLELEPPHVGCYCGAARSSRGDEALTKMRMNAVSRADCRGSLVRAAGRANKERRTCFSLLPVPRPMLEPPHVGCYCGAARSSRGDEALTKTRMNAARRADFRGSLVRAAGRANKERRTCFPLLSLPRPMHEPPHVGYYGDAVGRANKERQTSFPPLSLPHLKLEPSHVGCYC